MYSNMCVKIALCLALIVSIDDYVLKHRTLPLSAEGMTIEITVRSKEDPRHPLSTTRVDINEKDKTVVIATAEASSGALNHLSKAKNDLPSLESRNGVIKVGNCPEGYIKKGDLCIKPQSDEDDDY